MCACWMWYERNSLAISQEFKPNSTAQKVILYHGTLCPTFWSLCISYTRKICREKYIYSEEYGTRLCVVVIRVIFNMHQYLNSEVFDISHRRIYTLHSICTRCSLAPMIRWNFYSFLQLEILLSCAHSARPGKCCFCWCWCLGEKL